MRRLSRPALLFALGSLVFFARAGHAVDRPPALLQEEGDDGSANSGDGDGETGGGDPNALGDVGESGEGEDGGRVTPPDDSGDGDAAPAPDDEPEEEEE